MTNDKEREKAKQKNIAVIENAIAARNKVEKESCSLCFFFVLGVFFRAIYAHAHKSRLFIFCMFFKNFSLSLSLSLSFSRRRHPPEQRNSVIERKESLTSSSSLFFVFHYLNAV